MKHHIVPLRVYFSVFGALMVLTAVTVVAAFVDMGAMNDFVAMTIAVIKGTLVVLFFMHVKYSSKVIWVFAAAGFVWLLILFSFTLGDTLTRDWLSVGAPLPM